MTMVVQRYLIASGGFAVALLLTGVGFLSGFACLLVFALTSLVVGAVQRRRLVAERGRAVRPGAGRSRGRPLSVDSRDSPRSTARPRPSRVVHADQREGVEWPQLADYGW